MRRLLLLLFALIAVAPLSAGPPRDWSATVARTPAGSFVIGNPNARVKLVEYLSYTCSHCAAFVSASKGSLHDTMIRNGSVQIEVRHAVRDALDMSAAVLARCSGPEKFWGSTEAIFAAQRDWIGPGAEVLQQQAQRAAPLPYNEQLKLLAEGSGLAGLMRARGLSRTAFDACFAGEADLRTITAQTNAAFAKIHGTPGFEINGNLVHDHDWSTLEPKLRAAGAR